MNRAILQACLPAFIALFVLAFLLWLTVRISGARWNWRRLKELNRCQDGGVQNLSFVLTLPIFIIILQTIIQISQLMIGIMGVHYAAYASARAASVWLPADVYGGYANEPPNVVAAYGYVDDNGIVTMVPTDVSEKYQRIRLAAVLAVAPFCPSRDLDAVASGYSSSKLQNAMNSTISMYHAMVPDSTNQRIDARIDNKIRWADQNTTVIFEWREASNSRGRNTLVSPTYNPRNHDNPNIEWDPYEVGWQDAVTVYVVHRFALLPGPGRWLAEQLVWTNQLPSRVIVNIDPQQLDQTSGRPNTIVIPATATLVNEGLKSTFSYDHDGSSISGTPNNSFGNQTN